jgi:hypothetical protein
MAEPLSKPWPDDSNQPAPCHPIIMRRDGMHGVIVVLYQIFLFLKLGACARSVVNSRTSQRDLLLFCVLRAGAVHCTANCAISHNCRVRRILLQENDSDHEHALLQASATEVSCYCKQ